MKPQTDRSAERAGPVPASQRIVGLDALRGFALIGILSVNIAGFAGIAGAEADASWIDQAVAWVITYLTAGKFYVLFSFLFGIGFALQLNRATARGLDIRTFYRRRTGILLLLGLIHAAVWWPGDILRLYGTLGFALLAFRNRRTRTLLIWASVFLLIAVAVTVLSTAAASDSESVDKGVLFGRDLATWIPEAHHGSFLSLVWFQTATLPFGIIGLFIFQGFSSMAMFLLGLVAGRSGVFADVDMKTLGRKMLRWAIPIGVTLELVQIFSSMQIAEAVNVIGGPAVSAIYVGTLLLILATAWGGRLLSPLADMGRMALSNYLGQSLICSFVFSGYGLDLYQQLGPAALAGVVALVIAFEMVFSRWWLTRYRFGPAEWAWRSLTYRTRQPWRREGAQDDSNIKGS